jgi:hypothetical protein
MLKARQNWKLKDYEETVEISQQSHGLRGIKIRGQAIP